MNDSPSAHLRGQLLAGLGEHLRLLGLGIMVVDRTGRIVDADQVAEQLLGRRRAELATIADISILLAPEERFKRTVYRERRRQGELDGETFRTIVLLPDGSRRPVDASIVPIGRGNFTGVVVRDASHEATLDQAVDLYKALFDRMPVGVVVVDASDVTDPRQIRIWAVNAAASKVAGRELTGFVGRPLSEVFPWGRRFAEAARALSLRDTGDVEHFPDFVIGDPEEPSAVYRRTIVSLPEGTLALLLQDITRERLDDVRQRRLVERLVTLGDTERRSIAMGIHDDPIQQIAAASLLVAQLRRRSAGDDRAAWLDDVEASLRRATVSLRDLVFELAPPELVESGLASAVATSVGHLFANSGVTVDVDIVLDAEPAHAIQTTAFRIIAEALTNARKHAGAQWITVRARTDGQHIVAEVSDDGVGLSDAADHPGHLGMRSMRDRATAIGGTVEITADDHGTAVTVRLPLDGVPAQPATGGHGPIVIDTSPLLPDSAAESLQLELHSVRESASRYATDVRDTRARWSALAELRATLDALPLDTVTRASAAVEVIGRSVRDACVIRLVTADGAVLRQVACWHPDPEQLAYLSTWVLSDRNTDTSHPALIYRSQQPLLLEQDRFDWRLASDGPPPPPAPTVPHHAIGVPIRTGGTVLGVMTVVRDRTPDPLLPGDIAWVWALADVVASALPT